MAYSRFFMPLESEAAGYDFRGKTPSGRCIVEERGGAGKLTCWVQDLRPEIRYIVNLIFVHGGQHIGVPIGPLDVNEKGKADSRWYIDDSQLGSFDLKTVMAVALIVADASGVVAPLCGYRDKPTAWRRSFIVHGASVDPEVTPKPEHKPEPVQPAPEPAPELPPEPMIMHEPAPESEPEPVIVYEPEPEPVTVPELPLEKEIKPEPMSSRKHEAVVEPLYETELVAESVATPDPPPPAPAPARKPSGAKPASRATIAKDFRTALQELNEETLRQSPTRQENIQALNDIFAANESVSPFNTQSRETKWVRISLTDSVPLPYNRPRLLESQFVRAAYLAHGHLILGMTTDGTPAQYIIGVPGEYSPDLRPQAKRLGFSQFKSNENEPPKRGNNGYWLMFIDV